MIRQNATFAAPGAVVGICIESGADLLLQEEGVGVLAFQDPTYFLPCPNLNAALPASRARGGFAFLRAIFAPRLLHAATVVNPGGTGGLAGGLRSIFGAVSISELTLQFSQQPLDNQVGKPIEIEVRARGAGGTPLAGVRITVALKDIDETGAELSGVTELVTDSHGKARFTNLSLDKPGKYILIATGTVRSFTEQLESQPFKIRP